MRFLKRTALTVAIAPRAVSDDGAEGFSETSVQTRGSVDFVANALNSTANALFSAEYGVRAAQTIKLRLPPSAEINVGDGVKLSGEAGICWRCVEVNKSMNIIVARLERIADACN